LHIVRGGGRGKTETTEESAGCGGCVYSYPAIVNGTIEGDDLDETTVRGQFDVAQGDANGLVFPYSMDLESGATDSDQYNDSIPKLTMNGQMFQAGVIEIGNGSFAYSPSAEFVTSDSGADSDAAPTDVDAAAQPSNGAKVTTPAFELHRIGDAACPAN
ncbi:MAG: hypothetical protein ACRELY_00400, partial [Polyangiaceae bacterium]